MGLTDKIKEKAAEAANKVKESSDDIARERRINSVLLDKMDVKDTIGAFGEDLKKQVSGVIPNVGKKQDNRGIEGYQEEEVSSNESIGAQPDDSVVCPKCGKTNPCEYKYCIDCGYDFFQSKYRRGVWGIG